MISTLKDGLRSFHFHPFNSTWLPNCCQKATNTLPRHLNRKVKRETGLLYFRSTELSLVPNTVRYKSLCGFALLSLKFFSVSIAGESICACVCASVFVGDYSVTKCSHATQQPAVEILLVFSTELSLTKESKCSPLNHRTISVDQNLDPK